MLKSVESVIPHSGYQSLPHIIPRRNFASIPLFSEGKEAPTRGVSLINSIQIPSIRLERHDGKTVMLVNDNEHTVDSNESKIMTVLETTIQTTLSEETEVEGKVTVRNHGKLDVNVATKR